jgi:hypothetical protein
MLHGFLGLTCYYKKVLKNYGKIVAPLTSLLKNNSFSSSEVTEHAFIVLKDHMCTTPVLEVPNCSNNFIMKFCANVVVLG